MSLRRSRDREKQKKKNQKQYYHLHSQEIFNSRYMYITQIQDGTFGRVVRVYDSNSNHFMAMKIIVKQHIKDAQIEYRILQQLNQHIDHPGSQNIVHAFEAFNQNNAYCIIFEDLGLSLNQYLKKKGVHIHIKNVQRIIQDSLQGLDFIHTLGYTHTDLKPENILFVQRENDTKTKDYHVKLIDFGGAVSDKCSHTTLINTRQYRAPEVILRHRWTKQSDMWGLGCILVELMTGSTYFNPGNNDFFHLSLIEKTCQPIPLTMIEKSGQEAKEHFNEYQLSDSFLKWSREYAREIEEQPTIDELISDNLLRDLIHKILQVEPEKRLTPKEALQHDFLRHEYQ